MPEQERRMAIRLIRLGSPRTADEGLRIGTVRRPPRGVPKTECWPNEARRCGPEPGP